MTQNILGLIAETSIHAGAGKAVGVIDLPIMRESHTGWPCIYGSAVKGALRAKAELTKADWIADVFGPDTNNASEHAGALSVGDARLLLLPVRSLTTHFKWVACPALLNRAATDAGRMNVPGAVGWDSQQLLGEADAYVHQSQGNGSLFLEDFRFAAKSLDLTALITWLDKFVGNGFGKRLESQLVVVSDDMFSHLAQYTTAVTPHIAINNEKKTVKEGALWYEETLSAETVLYVAMMAQPSRKQGSGKDSTTVMKHVDELFPAQNAYLQLGGNETVGMGWCRVSKVGG